MTEIKILGSGSYGEVSIRNGVAVKKLSKLSHLIQEYIAIRYLKDCKYIVHDKGVNFSRLELYMELYDGSLRKWMEDERKLNVDISRDNIMKICHDILMGLSELHDRGLAHGDLKPGNILVRRSPWKLVLGDLGFVSVAKYAKVDRTAEIYRDPVIDHDPTHDMFSFGICFLELLANIRINRQATYDELKRIIQDKSNIINGENYQKIIYNLLHEDKTRRPTARFLLLRLYGESPVKWYKEKIRVCAPSQNSSDRVITSIPKDDIVSIRKLFKRVADEQEGFGIKRSQKGFGALLAYLDNYKVKNENYRIYVAVTLMILSSIFSSTYRFRENQIMQYCGADIKLEFIYDVLEKLISDHTFIKILLVPEESKSSSS
jgi:serine/threonine protein kinase